MYVLTNYGSNNQHGLIANIGHRDVIIDFHNGFVVHEQVKNVSHCGRYPAPSLLEKFVKTFGGMGVSITGS